MGNSESPMQQQERETKERLSQIFLRRVEAKVRIERQLEANEKRRLKEEERVEQLKQQLEAEEKRQLKAEERVERLKRQLEAEKERQREAEEEEMRKQFALLAQENSMLTSDLLWFPMDEIVEMSSSQLSLRREKGAASSRSEMAIDKTGFRQKEPRRRSKQFRSEVDLDSLRDHDMCLICFEPLSNPKFLTCHHTFCALCLYRLTMKEQDNTVIGCPSCRKITRLPPEGISGLPTNFYVISCLPDECVCDCIDQEHIMYCVDCDKAVCDDCLYPEHFAHKREQLHRALESKRNTLKKKVSDIHEMEVGLKSRLQTASQESRDVTKKTAVLEARILDQSALMLAAVHDARKKALKTLKTVSEDIQNGLSEKQKYTESYLAKIVQRRIQIERAPAGNDPGTIISAARSCELDTNNDARKDLEQYKPVTHPVLVGTSELETFEKVAFSAFGEVSTIQMTCGDKTDVEINKTFSCTEQVRIFSLCYVDDDSSFIEVLCSNARQEFRKRFSEDGTLLESVLHKMCHFKRYARGKRMAPDMSQTSNIISTFSKSHSVHYRLNRLNSKSPGKAVILSVVVNPNPFSIEGKKEFEINLTCVHRSFDVDDTETHFVVLEEARDPCGQRQVHLFQRPGGDAVATYKSPVKAFWPSDVCFYRLSVQVLLIADEANDVIHVVMIENKKIIFLRYLNIAPGSPLLISPTAINTDIHGRLWVGTKTGQIMAFKPVGNVVGAIAACSP